MSQYGDFVYAYSQKPEKSGQSGNHDHGTHFRYHKINGEFPLLFHLNPFKVFREQVDIFGGSDNNGKGGDNDRKDIDGDKIAFFGASLGAAVGVVLVALEKRIQASILYVGGFGLMKLIKAAPEVDQINFAPRVTIPTLMLNGRYDFLFPFETSQVPMYRFLGTPEGHKAHKVYETGHSVPRNEEIKETLDWLDRYFGSVKKK